MVRLRRYILGMEQINDPSEKSRLETVADLNGDGNVDVMDMALLKRYILNLIDIFPVEK